METFVFKRASECFGSARLKAFRTACSTLFLDKLQYLKIAERGTLISLQHLLWQTWPQEGHKAFKWIVNFAYGKS